MEPVEGAPKKKMNKKKAAIVGGGVAAAAASIAPWIATPATGQILAECAKWFMAQGVWAVMVVILLVERHIQHLRFDEQCKRNDRLVQRNQELGDRVFEVASDAIKGNAETVAFLKEHFG